MKKVLVLAAVGEASIGLVLLIVPSLVGRLLLGEDKAYDVVLGDAEKCKPGGDGEVPAVGSTVDVCNDT